MIRTHAFPDQRAVVRTIIPFVVIATLLFLYLGPVGILYALGSEVVFLLIYRLTVAVAGFLDPDVY